MWTNAKIIGHSQKRGEAGQVRGHKDFCMSRTQLNAFAECPAKWLAGEEVKEETKAMSFGSVLDCLTTTPDAFLRRFAVAPENYPVVNAKGVETGERKPWNLNSNWCKEWKAEKEAAGLSVVTKELFLDAQMAFTALHNDRPIASLIECSQKQVLIVADWQDEDTGLSIPFAGLIDLLPHISSPTWGKTIADIKTARNGNPATWNRVVDDSGYDIQAALYMDIYIAATGEDRTDFVHVVQENTFPFHVVSPAPALSEEFLKWGRTKYKHALQLYCHCLKTGVWPSYEPVGIPFASTQLISPDELWNYRKCAGMKEFIMPADPQPTATPERIDLYA